jgi:hypothetical protein
MFRVINQAGEAQGPFSLDLKAMKGLADQLNGHHSTRKVTRQFTDAAGKPQLREVDEPTGTAFYIEQKFLVYGPSITPPASLAAVLAPKAVESPAAPAIG